MEERQCKDCLRHEECDWLAFFCGFNYFFWVTDEMMEKLMNRGVAFIGCPYYTEDEAEL